MWISRRDYNNLIIRYEKRIDDLLNRLMSKNYSEYNYVKPLPEELPEPSSRTDEDEFNIEQARLNDLKELEKHADSLKDEMTKPLPRVMR